MAYKWKKRECDTDGIPYAKKKNTYLEKDGECAHFRTQEAADKAWVDGWHIPGRPETADRTKRKRKPKEDKECQSQPQT